MCTCMHAHAFHTDLPEAALEPIDFGRVEHVVRHVFSDLPVHECRLSHGAKKLLVRVADSVTRCVQHDVMLSCIVFASMRLTLIDFVFCRDELEALQPDAAAMLREPVDDLVRSTP